MNTKVIIASTLLTAFFIGSSANADMVGNIDDSVKSASVEIQKVSLVTPAAEVEVNR